MRQVHGGCGFGGGLALAAQRNDVGPKRAVVVLHQVDAAAVGELRPVAGQDEVEVERFEVLQCCRPLVHEAVAEPRRAAEHHVAGEHEAFVRQIDDHVAAGVGAAAEHHLDFALAAIQGDAFVQGDVRRHRCGLLHVCQVCFQVGQSGLEFPAPFAVFFRQLGELRPQPVDARAEAPDVASKGVFLQRRTGHFHARELVADDPRALEHLVAVRVVVVEVRVHEHADGLLRDAADVRDELAAGSRRDV